MNYYVFIDDNNGHFCEYYNFKSDATKAQIKETTEQMWKETPIYSRLGSKIMDLAEKLVELGFVITLEDNPLNRLYVDRIQVHCISGNY